MYIKRVVKTTLFIMIFKNYELIQAGACATH